MGNTDQDSAEWKNKYYEAAELLAETKAELDEFQVASKELEEELERELQRTESEKEKLRLISSKAEKECNEWKDKFINLQTLHNSMTNSLQRDLDTCRRECHTTKIQMRELEMGNDNLERNERAVASTLAELEIKYSKALEEKILLEHDLMDKANLEEALQRLKDEVRDAYEEMDRLKEQLKKNFDGSKMVLKSQIVTSPPRPPPKISDNPVHIVGLTPGSWQLGAHPKTVMNANEGPDYQVDHLVGDPCWANSKVEKETFEANQSRLLEDAREIPLSRSNTHPLPSSLPKRNPLPPLLVSEKPSLPRKGSAASSLSNLPAAKSKGVQMVSEMRARVRNLELKIHSRVPRLRMSSFSRSSSPRYLKSPAAESSTPSSQNRTSIDRFSIETKSRTSIESTNRNGAESPGWVLILEETPVRRSRKGDSDRRKGGNVNKPNPIGKNTEVATHTSEVTALVQEPQRSGNLRQSLQALTPEPTGGRSLTPTSLPMPMHSVGPGSSRPSQGGSNIGKHDATQAKKRSGVTRSTKELTSEGQVSKSAEPPRRRQSIGSTTATTSELTQTRITIKGGRSSLPNAFSSSSQSAHLSNTQAKLAESGLPSNHLSVDSKGSVPLTFSRSRIGRPSQSKRTLVYSSAAQGGSSERGED